MIQMIKSKLHISRLTILYGIWTLCTTSVSFLLSHCVPATLTFLWSLNCIELLVPSAWKALFQVCFPNGPSPTTQTKADLKFANSQLHRKS